MLTSEGKQAYVHMGSYGIGISRLVGAIIESSHDTKGIIWPNVVSPFDIGLIKLKSSDEKINNICDDIYSNLLNENVDVLYDDKKDNTGVKFSKMDLIGLPLQMIIGNKTIETNEVEIKYRKSGEVKYIKVENLQNFVQEIKKSSAV